MFLEDGDNHIPNVVVIIDDENVFPLAHHFSITNVLSIVALPIVTTVRQCVGNVHYRNGGDSIFMDMFWEGEKRCVSGPTDNTHKIPPRGPADQVS